ncbi:biotin/lipoate A/B protein ligase family protein [Schinkia azotoformans]|uniref:Octanoyl-[GcvH]:protein N-octanoyltransferase n=1 Tax=Schinkia azotoformans LMG 9581 TaxID=1131731 RepID=K6D4P0_SCHAZ|nr:biotin/lipoate A/B protein ligase family protein [Schinkia azotoformans]EKN62993.1 lipoate-protein ligase A [Schinkia azotoformans LMG 9581]MEC1639284.1 biotin/lipoate A/B protein ligase family protein [Schinkia azotoformans]MEC1945871.1 biotin/lipoate A/B protein ligase family protein [Schinkia azotoformans]
MQDINPLLQQPEWRYIDHSSLGLYFSPLQSFAYDDTFCSSVGSGQSAPVIRTWIHAPTIVLGIQDGRLPFLEQGVAFLEEKGYQSIVRNSGGLAVVLDDGILNLSLILPEGKGIDINRGYEAMWNLIQLMLSGFDVQVDAREIVGSYCPGSFDLSIGDKKFAGISQRRLRGGVAVQIYLCVTGSGSLRAEIVREFYHRALQGEKTKFTYPTIVPSTMASLSELLGKTITTEQLITLMLKTFGDLDAGIATTPLSEKELELYQYNYDRILKRNEK